MSTMIEVYCLNGADGGDVADLHFAALKAAAQKTALKSMDVDEFALMLRFGGAILDFASAGLSDCRIGQKSSYVSVYLTVPVDSLQCAEELIVASIHALPDYLRTAAKGRLARRFDLLKLREELETFVLRYRASLES